MPLWYCGTVFLLFWIRWTTAWQQETPRTRASTVSATLAIPLGSFSHLGDLMSNQNPAMRKVVTSRMHDRNLFIYRSLLEVWCIFARKDDVWHRRDQHVEEPSNKSHSKPEGQDAVVFAPPTATVWPPKADVRCKKRPPFCCLCVSNWPRFCIAACFVLVGCLAGWLVACLVGSAVGWSVGWLLVCVSDARFLFCILCFLCLLPVDAAQKAAPESSSFNRRFSVWSLSTFELTSGCLEHGVYEWLICVFFGFLAEAGSTSHSAREEADGKMGRWRFWSVNHCDGCYFVTVIIVKVLFLLLLLIARGSLLVINLWIFHLLMFVSLDLVVRIDLRSKIRLSTRLHLSSLIKDDQQVQHFEFYDPPGSVVTFCKSDLLSWPKHLKGVSMRLIEKTFRRNRHWLGKPWQNQ